MIMPLHVMFWIFACTSLLVVVISRRHHVMPRQPFGEAIALFPTFTANIDFLNDHLFHIRP